jgi:hypothetical protein
MLLAFEQIFLLETDKPDNADCMAEIIKPLPKRKIVTGSEEQSP